MNLATLLLALYLILVGLSLLGVIAISNTILGLLALIAGIAMLVSGLGVNTNLNRR